MTDSATAGPDETLLSLQEYHELVKKLALRVEALEQSNVRLLGQRDVARRKLKVQHCLIEHLRERLEVVTGLDLHADEALAGGRADRKRSPLSIGRAVKRLRADRSPAADTDSAETLPAIDPAEFLPIADSDSALLRRCRDVVRRVRNLPSAWAASVDQISVGGRVRT